jgi:PAS domain S-box-containing protein
MVEVDPVMASDLELRILVLAPTAKDAALTKSVLDGNSIPCEVCSDIPALIQECQAGVGGLLVAEEVLLNSDSSQLVAMIAHQPPWSDLPVLLVTRQGIDSPAIGPALASLGNVTLIERPTRLIGLTNAARNALRARKRQYQARDLLIEHGRIASELGSSEQQYRTLVEQVKDYAIFMIDLTGRATSWNEGVLRVLGFTETEFIGLDVAKHIFTPEDQVKGVPEMELETAARTGTASNDRWMKRSDGGHFWASGITSALYDPHGKHIGYTKVMRDLTRAKEAEDALKQADRRKDEFLATLAHELRNPLAPIRNSLHILRLAATNDHTLENVCTMLDRQVNHLVRLVDDLLEVSRITRGKIELRKEEIDLSVVARSAIETSRPLIDAANHSLRVDLPNEPITLWGDPIRLGQVFANLLNNAAKYTNERGEIWFSARREANEAIVSVRDNGVGIPKEMLPNVFEMFMQVDRTTKRAQGGLGIGLTLVKSLVELHGGTVGVHSEPSEAGSEFIVRLPIFRTHRLDKPNPSSPKPMAENLKSRRVLVVDDNIDAASSLRILLKLKGAEVQVVNSGPAALEAIESLRPSVVLLDIGMPGMDGYEVAQRVRQNSEYDDIFLIALTGWGQEEDRQRTREAGFDYHLVKPANISELQELLANR